MRSLAESGRLSDWGGAWLAAAREREWERRRACVAALVLFAGGEWKTEPGGWSMAGGRCLEFARMLGLMGRLSASVEVQVLGLVEGSEEELLMVEEAVAGPALVEAEGCLFRPEGGQVGLEEDGGSGWIWSSGT